MGIFGVRGVFGTLRGFREVLGGDLGSRGDIWVHGGGVSFGAGGPNSLLPPPRSKKVVGKGRVGGRWK